MTTGFTEKSYEAEVNAYNEICLTSTEEQWDKRRDVITNLKASLEEAVLLENFIATSLIVSNQIIECIKSERTQLCNLAMDYVEEIAKHAESKFDPLAEHYLPVILKNCGRTNKIVRLKAGNCLMGILANVGPTSWFGAMLNEKTHENKDIRFHVAKGLSVILNMDKYDITHFLSPIEETIAVAIGDASSEVREFGLQSYRQFFQKLPEREQSFRANLDISTLKTLEKLQARQAATTNKKSQRPGIAELKKQMKAKMMANKQVEDVVIMIAEPEKAPDTSSEVILETVKPQEDTQNVNNSYQDTTPESETSINPIEQSKNSSEVGPPSPKRPAEHTKGTSPPPKKMSSTAIPQLNKALFGEAEKALPTKAAAPKPQLKAPKTARPNSSLEMSKPINRPPSASLVKSNASRPALSNPAPGLKRTSVTVTGGAQRVVNKTAPLKKSATTSISKKPTVEPKAPLQSQNRTIKKPLMKPVIAHPTAKVDSGMPTPNTKRSGAETTSQIHKRTLSPHIELNNTLDSKLPKPTRFKSGNFSRPTASSNARVSATSEAMKLKEANTRGSTASGKTRKIIGTTGPLRVKRSN
ncbi:hypothetical protein K7432_011569 [Basidiobolus ranarum]|uniref:TOG domain-containing protein n=1 Tax=Basidiobolus ranarum TaxID=34480 RepID=A0ABR2WM50_9FUNG